MQARVHPGTGEASCIPPRRGHETEPDAAKEVVRGPEVSGVAAPGANKTRRWYRRAKATKPEGMVHEESECADSTDEGGEPTPGEPSEGGGAPV